MNSEQDENTAPAYLAGGGVYFSAGYLGLQVPHAAVSCGYGVGGGIEPDFVFTQYLFGPSGNPGPWKFVAV